MILRAFVSYDKPHLLVTSLFTFTGNFSYLANSINLRLASLNVIFQSLHS